MDKPVILTSFDGERKLYYWKSARRLIDYTHLKKYIGLGGAKVVNSYESLKTTTLKYLADPNYDLAKRRNALEMECHLNDGNATERVVKTMVKILGKINPIDENR